MMSMRKGAWGWRLLRYSKVIFMLLPNALAILEIVARLVFFPRSTLAIVDCGIPAGRIVVFG